MRILLITEYLPPQIHGVATRFQHHIAHLRKLGHVVHVAGPANAPLTTIPLVATPFYPFSPDVCVCTLHPPSVVLILGLVRELDVVHLVCPTANPFFFTLLLPIFSAFHIPVVLSWHCTPSQLQPYTGSWTPLALSALQQFHTSYEPYVAMHLCPTVTAENAAFLDFSKRVGVIPTGIDSQLFHHRRLRNARHGRRLDGLVESAQCRTLVYVGRLSPEKDVETMVRFFSRLVSIGGDYADYRLRIIGDGPSRASLERLCTDEHMTHVELMGAIAHHRLPEYYRSAQAFVTFSVSEMYGFTNLEALACGTPVDYPACDTFDRYYTQAFPHTRFDPTDFHSFHRAVDFTSGNVKLRRTAIAFCADKDWHSATRQLCDVYQQCIDGEAAAASKQV